jgi:hypothetical protein
MRHESRLGGKVNMPRGPKSERGFLAARAVAESERSRLYIVGIRRDARGGSRVGIHSWRYGGNEGAGSGGPEAGNGEGRQRLWCLRGRWRRRDSVRRVRRGQGVRGNSLRGWGQIGGR